ncbi:hypothetical protein D3C84_305000 [compost metagenome]
MHCVLSALHVARFGFQFASAEIIAGQQDALRLAAKQARVFVVVFIRGLIEQPLGFRPGQTTYDRLATQLRQVHVFNDLTAGGGDGLRLGLSGLVVEHLHATAGDRLGSAIQTVENLLPQHDVVDADQRR